MEEEEEEGLRGSGSESEERIISASLDEEAEEVVREGSDGGDRVRRRFFCVGRGGGDRSGLVEVV